MSKWLALHLRHHPERIGLSLDASGWADVDAVLAGAAASGLALDLDEVREIVETNEKRRYELDERGRRIRARQGHSVAVDLGLAPVEPPDVLYHGTVERSVASILGEGILPMGRRQVHLSADMATAEAVGQRRGRPVVLVVDSADMAAAGFEFFVSTNGVWLCDRVPPEFVSRR